MNLPDGRPLIVHNHVLPDVSGGRLVLWHRGASGDGCQEWERIGIVPSATVASARGLRSIAATSLRARQRLGWGLGRVLHRLVRSREERDWRLPNGGVVTPCGGRRTDLRLTWPEDPSTPLGKGYIAQCWPGDREIRSLGPALYLVAGLDAAPPAGGTKAAEDVPQETELAITEHALDAAIRSGDRRRVVVASADLGLVLLHIGQPQRAAKILSEALVEADRIGDASLRADVANNLAHTELYLGQARTAYDRLGPVLAYARPAGDVACEKLALERMARALLELGDRDGGLGCLKAAAILAARLGDARHEADLLWLLAIHLADEWRRDEAVAAATTAIERLRQLCHPALDWYAHHLEGYRTGASLIGTRGTAPEGPVLGGKVDVSTAMPPSHGVLETGAAGPLRMAITAAKAMAAFVASGFKVAAPQVFRERTGLCMICDHHTGTRCRVCGCITAAKARIQHERCPLGKW